jgi:hypothetical protein
MVGIKIISNAIRYLKDDNFHLGSTNYNDGNLLESLPYFEIGSLYGDECCILGLIKYYEMTGENDKKKYYEERVINVKSAQFYRNCARIEKKKNNIDNVVKYYKFAIDAINDIQAVLELAKFYEKNDDFMNAEKYYLLGIGFGDRFSLIEYANMCSKISNYEKVDWCYNEYKNKFGIDLEYFKKLSDN